MLHLQNGGSRGRTAWLRGVAQENRWVRESERKREREGGRKKWVWDTPKVCLGATKTTSCLNLGELAQDLYRQIASESVFLGWAANRSRFHLTWVFAVPPNGSGLRLSFKRIKCSRDWNKNRIFSFFVRESICSHSCTFSFP